MTTTNELVLQNGRGEISAPAARTPAALAPASYDEMFRLAESMFRSKMFGVSSPEQAMVVLMTGLELGFSPAQAFRGIHVINNKPTLSADMMVAVCKSRPDVCHYFRMVETTDERATYETHRVGEPGPQRITFTSADAKRAGLLSNPTHQKYPGPMLRARSSSALARMVYSDLILGLYTPDEIESIPTPERSAPAIPRPEPVNVTPKPAQSPAAQKPATPKPAAADTVPGTIQERRTHLRRLMQSMSDADMQATLEAFTDVFGRNDYGAFDLDQCRRAIAAIESGAWPDETPGSGEADPFDDANGFKDQQPALMEADAQQKGHGDS